MLPLGGAYPSAAITWTSERPSAAEVGLILLSMRATKVRWSQIEILEDIYIQTNRLVHFL